MASPGCDDGVETKANISRWVHITGNWANPAYNEVDVIIDDVRIYERAYTPDELYVMKCA